MPRIGAGLPFSSPTPRGHTTGPLLVLHSKAATGRIASQAGNYTWSNRRRLVAAGNLWYNTLGCCLEEHRRCAPGGY